MRISPEPLDAMPAGVVDDLLTARHEALAEYDPETTTWEYGGRTWEWPGGEDLTYFWDLCPEERAVVEELRNAGFDPVGIGTGRVVLDPPSALASDYDEDVVVKLPRYGPTAEMGDGRAQNRLEADCFDRWSDYPLLTVLEAHPHGDWLVMVRARILGDDDPDVDRILRGLEATVEGLPVDVHLDELKAENVGEHDDRHWLVDYGRPPGPRVDPDVHPRSTTNDE